MKRSKLLSVLLGLLLMSFAATDAMAMMNPTTGRFIQADPLGYPDGMNRYGAYHVMHGGVDPSGMESEGLLDEPTLRQAVDQSIDNMSKGLEHMVTGDPDALLRGNEYSYDPNDTLTRIAENPGGPLPSGWKTVSSHEKAISHSEVILPNGNGKFSIPNDRPCPDYDGPAILLMPGMIRGEWFEGFILAQKVNKRVHKGDPNHQNIRFLRTMPDNGDTRTVAIFYTLIARDYLLTCTCQNGEWKKSGTMGARSRHVYWKTEYIDQEWGYWKSSEIQNF